MSVTAAGEEIVYDSRRKNGTPPATLSATYRPTGAPFAAARGSLEYFLTERYCLYHRNRRGVPYRLEIHHPPWSLQQADAEFACNTMAEAAGIGLPGTRPLLHFAKRQDMVAWPASPLAM
jgi:hypothetical protein